MSHAPLPEGEREVRVAVEGGLFVPGPVLRLVERGGRVSGELIARYPAQARRPGATVTVDVERRMVAELAAEYDCASFVVSGREYRCRAPVAGDQPDWTEVLRRLDAARLADPPPDLRSRAVTSSMHLDGAGRQVYVVGCDDGLPRATVEIRSGSGYMRYEYGGCGPLSEAQARHSAAIQRVYEEAVRVARAGARRDGR